MPPRKQGTRTIARPTFVRPKRGADSPEDAALLCSKAARGGQIKSPGDESPLQRLLYLLSETYCGKTVFPLEGELSSAMMKLHRSKVGGLRIGTKKGVTQYVEGLLEAMAVANDPSNEQALKQIVAHMPEADRQQGRQHLEKGDLSPLNVLFKQYARESGTRRRLDLFPLLSHMRAAQAFARCVVLYNESPFAIIARAREGDRQAVLDLIKVDKAFLHDSCSEKVVKDAESECDSGFLRQLARALRHEPKLSNTKRIRLLLYGLMALGTELPSAPELQRLLDPEGTRFKGIYSFERFVRRCRNELKQRCTDPPAVLASSRRSNPKKGALPLRSRRI